MRGKSDARHARSSSQVQAAASEDRHACTPFVCATGVVHGTLAGMDHGGKASVFFAYASRPASCGEAMSTAATGLRTLGHRAVTWQQLHPGGRVVIDVITKANDKCDVVVAEISSMNRNVLFEAGYALAKNKGLLFAIDESLESARRLSAATWKPAGGHGPPSPAGCAPCPGFTATPSRGSYWSTRPRCMCAARGLDYESHAIGLDRNEVGVATRRRRPRRS